MEKELNFLELVGKRMLFERLVACGHDIHQAIGMIERDPLGALLEAYEKKDPIDK